ncbi:hypothetical protein NIE88_09500 [Sporolactobacillus shoreicorticis]|uniref:Flagellar hook-length control protein-like C-terminal domain-containing protein n=1 Tax=Sporolactobacillus shoreicorticis TaxID=1923877 RepID=A0ABW5S7W8_9BACL|nr:hypothetical protein [Sporolactobacillus shoreicorticis]MCO7126009.1 hypothetical protein [Sporolactobacillus shoreicorticis]
MNFQPYAINQSQIIGTYAPEQILRGKVLDLLPDRTALVRLGTKQVVAKIASADPPLKVGQDYLFQIKQGNSPLIAKLIERKQADRSPNMIDDVFHALQLKEDALSRKIAQTFLDHGDLLTRESLLQAKSLLKMSSDFSGDMQTIRWMMNRRIPLTESFFKIAKELQNSDSISSKLDTMVQEIQRSGTQTPSVERLKNALSNFAVPKDGNHFAQLYQQISDGKREKLFQSFIADQTSVHSNAAQKAIKEFMTSPMSLKDMTHLMKELKINASPQTFRDAFRNFVLERIPNLNDRLAGTDTKNLLFDTLKQLGFDYEFQISEWMKNDSGSERQPETLKGHLLAVIQDSDAPYALRKAAQEVVQKITGEQLQMASADPYVAQFSLQIPIPFQKALTNVSVYWEGKRDRKGTIDPNFCTIVLWLELTHLKETLVTIHVQNRSVTLNVQNSKADLRSLLASGESALRERLSKAGYQLLSLTQTEKIDSNLMKKAVTPLTQTDYRMDVKV